MDSSLDGLRIVVLECPYDSWNEPLARELFDKMVTLKLAGYGCEYPYGSLPLDTTDFIGTHHLVCREREGKFVPVMGYKSITLERCGFHNVAFPALTVVHSSGASAHVEEVRRILDRCARDGIGMLYGSSWTIDPGSRKDRDLRNVLKDLMGAMMVFHYSEVEKVPEHMGCGIPRFKTEKFFQDLGYRPITSANGAELPGFAQASLQGETAVMLHCPGFTDLARARAERFRSLWESRVVVTARQTRERKIAA